MCNNVDWSAPHEVVRQECHERADGDVECVLTCRCGYRAIGVGGQEDAEARAWAAHTDHCLAVLVETLRRDTAEW